MKSASSFHRKVILTLLLAGLATTCTKAPPAFECPDKIGCVRIPAGEPIKIGVLQALSGEVAPLGQAQVRGIQLAIDKRGGEILNHPIILHMEDTGCTAEGGANAALKIIADPQTVAILGTTCSGSAATAAHAMSEAGLTMISGSNSAPFLTAIAGHKASQWNEGYFRTAFNEESSGKTAAIYAFRELGVRRAATINDGDLFTRGLTEGFEKVFAQLGGQIVLSTAVNKGEKEMRPVLTAVLNSKAELIFFPLFQPEGNYLLLQARKSAEFESIHLMSDGALVENSFIEDVKAAAIGMLFVGPDLPKGPAVDALADAYFAKYKIQPATNYYPDAYDAAGLLLAAIENVAVQWPDGTLYIGRQALREALYTTKDYPGIAGDLACDRFGDCADPVFNVMRLEDPDAGIQGLLSNIVFSHAPNKKTIQ
ncbi:MAG: branched-chain amino acid ABC transporter substrate-binding protein [Desulfobacteraceae bacterium]|jgi:branched-chain amino acid transport system substrate-binding protein